MADEDVPLPPIEIPWKLAATTQPLSAGEPAETALSLFFFEPDDETLTSKFPDEKLVFVKFTASISPASFPPELSRVAASFLGEGIPCQHVLLDLKVRNAASEVGTIRPYFHAAAPLARRMVQSGVVGADIYEGEADGIAIGKSGSQVNESLRSHSDTVTKSGSAGVDLGLISFGGSVRSTATDVASDRAVSQVVDTTNREASEERRELISHTTRVENIISLLSAKYIGTPHLSFSVSPQPLQQLSVDPADPNLWFQQLLARRSSGIEGIQEFTAVLVIPKGTDFCINARLRRVCLLDSPPGPFVLERFTGNLLQFARMVNYLNDTFPVGTPLDELDIDIIGGLTSGTFKRPVVALWGLRLGEELVVASVVSPGASAGVAQRGSANYKHFLEAWLDTLRDEYQREASRSPLERGVLFGENRFLDTCFGTSPGGWRAGRHQQQRFGQPAVPRRARPGPVRHRRDQDSVVGPDRLDADASAGDHHALERDRAAGHDAAHQRLEVAGGAARCERSQSSRGAGRHLAQAAAGRSAQCRLRQGGGAASPPGSAASPAQVRRRDQPGQHCHGAARRAGGRAPERGGRANPPDLQEPQDRGSAPRAHQVRRDVEGQHRDPRHDRFGARRQRPRLNAID